MTRTRFVNWYCEEYGEDAESADAEWEAMLADPVSISDSKRGQVRIAVAMEDFITVKGRIEQGQQIEAGQRDLKNVSHESFMDRMNQMQAGSKNFENPLFAQLLGSGMSLASQVAMPFGGGERQNPLLAIGGPLRSMLGTLAPVDGSRFFIS